MTPTELSNLTWHLGILSLGIIFAIFYHANGSLYFFFLAIFAVMTGIVLR